MLYEASHNSDEEKVVDKSKMSKCITEIQMFYWQGEKGDTGVTGANGMKGHTGQKGDQVDPFPQCYILAVPPNVWVE